MATYMPNIMPIFKEEGEEQPMTSIPSHQEAKIYQISQGNVYLCLIGSSCILSATLNVIEAGDQETLIVSLGLDT